MNLTCNVKHEMELQSLRFQKKVSGNHIKSFVYIGGFLFLAKHHVFLRSGSK